MTDKTPIGIEFLDQQYGGTFRGRPLLLSGGAKAGKTIAAFHFMRRGIRLQERCLMLSARPAADIVVQADAMGMRFSEAVEEGSLILLEYSDDVPGRHSESSITLPPDSFLQLADMISAQAVARLVLDTCLPWVAVRGSDRLAEHVFSFTRSLDRMGVTTLLTMPRAASLAASRLYKLVEDQVPVSLTLGLDEASEDRLLTVNKYLGMDDKVGREIAFEVLPGKGIVERPLSGPAMESPTAPLGGVSDAPAANPGRSTEKVRFSSAVFGDD
jgi:KaiC/GvpD/RAD55 family RecA-like ATPase